MTRLAKTDVLFAHIALHVAPGLSPPARRVGSALVEHFNRRTGQCDPSLERLARMLGMGRTAVANATAELCAKDEAGQPIGLFERVTHGGRSGRTCYVPLWDRLNDIVDDWDLRMKDGSAPSNVRKPGRSDNGKHANIVRKPGRASSGYPDVDSPDTRTQTGRSNRLNKPTDAAALSAREETDTSDAEKPNGRKGLMSEERPASRRLPLLRTVVGGKAVPKREAAEAAQARRLTAEIQRLPQDQRAAAWLAAMGEAGQ